MFAHFFGLPKYYYVKIKYMMYMFDMVYEGSECIFTDILMQISIRNTVQ